MSASVRKKGYLHKLPVKGVVKVGACVLCAWAPVLHARVHGMSRAAAYAIRDSHSPFSPTQKWSRKWFVLHATTHEGVMRVEYFDEEDHEAPGLGKRTIPLRGAHGIVQSAGSKTRPFVFEFSSQIGGPVQDTG